MKYVDGFVLAVPKKKLPAYFRMARQAAKIWRQYGATAYCECQGDDLNVKVGLPFPRLAKTRPGETVVFSWIEYKSRAHRDRVIAKVMKDPRIENMCSEAGMPFDPKRMAYGGFKAIIDA